MAVPFSGAVDGILHHGTLLRDATAARNPRVLMQLLGPAYRGLVRRRGHGEDSTDLQPGGTANFDWRYRREHPELTRLYEAAKASQWNSTKDLDWKIDVDPFARGKLIPDSFIPPANTKHFKKLTKREQAIQRHAMLSWMLSQFLHGEQGALYAAAQITEAVPWMDAKLFGSTQVVDEARHVEVFHAYLTKKLERLYEINDNLYVVVDAVMSAGDWDYKFLGMQIMIEGLALGTFGLLRKLTREPLLKDVLGYVIKDEARHVHYGVLALQEYYEKVCSPRVRRDREDFAFELTLLMRNRFLAHEIHQEFYAHAFSRRQWNRLIEESELMSMFRRTMFKRIIPNLKRIGLLSDRVRPRYEALGLLRWERGKAAPDLTAADLLR